MAILPLRPRLKHHGGSNEKQRRKADDYNKKAWRIAEHLNALIANNPNEIQQYIFGFIAADLQVTADEVRNAIGDGGHNGITLRVTENDRRELERYKTKSG